MFLFEYLIFKTCLKQFFFYIFRFVDFFAHGTDFNIEYDKFRKFATIKDKIFVISKTSVSDKNKVLSVFSSHWWTSMSIEEKKKHSFSNCQGCLDSPSFKKCLAIFPIKKSDFRSLKKANQFNLFSGEEKSVSKPLSKGEKKKVLLEAKKDIESQFSETAVLR